LLSLYYHNIIKPLYNFKSISSVFSNFMMKHLNSKHISKQPQLTLSILSVQFASSIDYCCSRCSQTVCDSRRLSRLYGIHPPSIWRFLNFIFYGARSPRTCLHFRVIYNPREPSWRYIMRNSYRDVAYHCSGKQRNPITGWQLNSLCRRAAF